MFILAEQLVDFSSTHIFNKLHLLLNCVNLISLNSPFALVTEHLLSFSAYMHVFQPDIIEKHLQEVSGLQGEMASSCFVIIFSHFLDPFFSKIPNILTFLSILKLNYYNVWSLMIESIKWSRSVVYFTTSNS